jgi:hypothetical protein
MKRTIFISMFIGIFVLSLISASYIVPEYYNITIVLDSNYTVQSYSNVIVVLGEEASTNCNPSLNTNWIITDIQICDGVQVTTGSGGIIITSGNLTLINGANVTAKGLNISASGDRVFVIRGSELRI